MIVFPGMEFDAAIIAAGRIHPSIRTSQLREWDAERVMFCDSVCRLHGQTVKDIVIIERAEQLQRDGLL